jgi:deazaflavin-dependent oxidoreductase (nitroreductase family)
VPDADGSPVRPDGAGRSSRRPRPIVITVRTPLCRCDVAGLREQLRRLLRSHEAADVVCDVSGLTHPDAVCIDALTRLQLDARRDGRRILLHGAHPALLRLLAFAGLREILPATTDPYAGGVAFDKTPNGTRGAPPMPRLGGLSRLLQGAMIRIHRRAGNRFMGMDVLYLTTVGARTGQRRQTPLAHYPDPDGWLIVASAGGTKEHPGWYHNIAAHPDQVWIEVAGDTVHVNVEQLDGQPRAEAWRRITAEQARYEGYQQKTDRIIPVLRLTRAG